MNLHHKALIAQISGFINKILFIEKNSIFEYGDVKLYPSEIHLILFIHQEQDTNATRMAERLGVTKGAVSQTLSRLEKKGILRKIKDPFKKNELSIEFTSLGQSVLDHYLQLTAELHQQYDRYLSSLTESERTTIKGFLSHVEVIMDRVTDKLHLIKTRFDERINAYIVLLPEYVVLEQLPGMERRIPSPVDREKKWRKGGHAAGYE